MIFIYCSKNITFKITIIISFLISQEIKCLDFKMYRMIHECVDIMNNLEEYLCQRCSKPLVHWDDKNFTINKCFTKKSKTSIKSWNWISTGVHHGSNPLHSH